MTDEEPEFELDPDKVIEKVDIAPVLRSIHDTAYVTALKTALGLVRTTNTDTAISALVSMIAIFNEAPKEEE